MRFSDQLLTYRHERAFRVPWFMLVCLLLAGALTWYILQLPRSAEPNSNPNNTARYTPLE